MGAYRKTRTLIIIFMLFLLTITPVIAEEIKLIQTGATTGQDQNYYYIKFQKANGLNDYFGISKSNLGTLVLGHDEQFTGRMYMTPAFQVGGNWYLCPIRNLNNINSNIQQDRIIWSSIGQTLTCYRYSNPLLTQNADFDLNGEFYIDQNDQLKITANVTVLNQAPTDTGFGFAIFPTGLTDYRSVNINGQLIDITIPAQSFPTDKSIEFHKLLGGSLRQIFDWSDMPDTGNEFMETILIGGQPVLLIGTYGYGATNNIYIDPTFTVDFSPIPGILLTNGTVSSGTDTSFALQTDITTGISDDSDATTYQVRKGTQIVNKKNTTDGSYEIVNFLGSAGDSLGVSFDLGTINEINGDVKVCMQSSQDGVAVNRLRINNTVTGINFPQQTGIDDPTQYSCLNVGKNNFTNGKNIIGLSCLSGCTNPNNRIFMDTDTTAPYGQSYLDTGSGFVLQSSTDYAITTQWNTTNTSNGIAITGTWNQTDDPMFEWFLRIRKTTTGTNQATVYGYSDNNTINLGQIKTQSLAGTGYFNINISSIVEYETNTAGLSFTKLRFYTDNPSSFSEVRLRKETNDTQSPTINSFSTNTSSIGCLETVTYTANVTDNIDVDFVNFTILNLGEVSTTKTDDIYTYILKPQDINGVVNYNWTQIEACDILGTCNTTNPNLNVAYSCDFDSYINILHNPTTQTIVTNTTATINWTTTVESNSTIRYGTTPTTLTNTQSSASLVTNHELTLTGLLSGQTYYYNITSALNPTSTIGTFNFTTSISCNFVCSSFSVCQINDTQQCQAVTETNGCGMNFTGDIDTYNQACNFCSEDLEQNLDVCTMNGTQTFDYVDNNFISCCFLTGLPSDCSILTSPFNETGVQACVFFNNTFQCDFPTNPYWDERMPLSCEIPLINGEETFSCKTEVFSDDELLQSNPEQDVRISSLITLKGKRTEEKEFFTPSNRLLNAYITQDDIDTNTMYELHVTCISMNTTLFYGQLFTPQFEEVGSPTINRLRYFGDNATTYMFLFFIILILISLLGVLWRRLRTERVVR